LQFHYVFVNFVLSLKLKHIHTMQIAYSFLAVIAAYLIGSIATSVWVGRVFYGIDVREHGSGNAGASNTFRVLGVKAGIPVLVVDALKGWVAVHLIYFLNEYYVEGSVQWMNMSLGLAFAAVIGHIFPVYVGFKGGKGVATLVGIIIAVHPWAALICIGVFVVVLLVSRYVSLSSILSGVLFPFVVIGYYDVRIPSLMIFSVLVSILLILSHKKNIGRLMRHEENKANLFKWK